MNSQTFPRQRISRPTAIDEPNNIQNSSSLQDIELENEVTRAAHRYSKRTTRYKSYGAFGKFKEKSMFAACLQIWVAIIGVTAYIAISNKTSYSCIGLPDDPSCPDKYFSASYTQAREKFLYYSALLNNTDLYHLPIYSLSENEYHFNNNNNYNYKCSSANDYHCVYSTNDCKKYGMTAESNSKTFPSIAACDVKTLYTDITILNEDSKSNHMLLYISGVNGVDGYLGSAVQTAIMEHISNFSLDIKDHKKKPISGGFSYTYGKYWMLNHQTIEHENGNPGRDEPPIIILVHALNPYGFYYNQKSNENNIHLNRNLNPRDMEYIQYQRMNDFFNPLLNLRSMIFTVNRFTPFYFLSWIFQWVWYKMQWFAQYWISSFYYVWYLNINEHNDMFKILDIGQNYNPYGIEYIYDKNVKYEPSHLILQEFLVNKFGEHSDWKMQINKLTVVDVGTGFGPKLGRDFCSMNVGNYDRQYLTEILGHFYHNIKNVDGGEEVHSFYLHFVQQLLQSESGLNANDIDGLSLRHTLVSSISEWELFRYSRFLNAYQMEYYPIYEELIGDQDFDKLKQLNFLMNYARDHMKDGYFVNEVKWKKKTIHQGFSLFRRLLVR